MRKCLLLACCLLTDLAFADYIGEYATDGVFEGRWLPDGSYEITYVIKNPTYANLCRWSWDGTCVDVPTEVNVHTFRVPVIEVSANVFMNNRSIVEVRLPNSIQEIGSCAFDGCTSLASVSLPDSLSSIGRCTFRGCTSLVSVDLPDSLPTIGEQLFYQCTSLSSVDLPDSLLSIGNSAFGNCTLLVSVDLPDSLLSIDFWAFSGCTSLVSVDLPDGLLSINGGAFGNCTSLASVVLPDKITDVKEQTFKGCLSLETIVIPNAVKSISQDAFDGCEKITTVTIPSRFRMSEVFPNSYRTIKSVTIADGSTTICPFAFHECRKLVSVVIPEGVTEIGESAFENCRNLESVTIPQSVKRIGMCAFYGCISLKEVKHLGEEPEIGKAAFAGTALASGQTVEMLINSANVHYVLNSIRPEFAVPLSEDTGFRNIITEIKGGAVSIPSTWSSNYANFEKKFGADFTKALMRPTGKIGGDGKELMVWQDYVAGTDPTDEKDVFTASVTVVDGKVVVSYSPELDDERKAVRKYTTWGKQKLQDAEWTEVPPGQEGNYNFFKVSVEMK